MIAAVSARSTGSPRPTTGSDAAPLVGGPAAFGPDDDRRRGQRRSPTEAIGEGRTGERGNRREVGDREEVGQPGPPALHRRLARHALQPGVGGLGPSAVPAHHGAGRVERSDLVDAQLGELLHDELGALTLHGSEGHADRRTRSGHGDDLDPSARHRRPAAESHRTPSTRTVADRRLVTGAQPQRAAEVVVVVGVQHRRVDVVDEHERAELGRGAGTADRVRRIGRPPSLQLNADLILEKNPRSAARPPRPAAPRAGGAARRPPRRGRSACRRRPARCSRRGRAPAPGARPGHAGGTPGRSGCLAG